MERKTLDIRARRLTPEAGPALAALVTGGVPIVETLDPTLPEAQDLTADWIALAADGTLHHVEWQAWPDPGFVLRMLAMWVVLARRHSGRAIRQTTLWIGSGQPPPNRLLTADVSFRYHVVVCAALDPAPFLASPATVDVLLAVLMGPAASVPGTVRSILARLAPLEERARRDAVSRLASLAMRRGALGVVVEEAQRMPIEIDYMADPYMCRLIETWKAEASAQGRLEGERLGRAEGQAALLLRVLEGRFGAVPEAVRSRVRAAAPEQLEAWALKVASVESPEALVQAH